MSNIAKTAIFIIVAVILGGAAYLSAPNPPTLEYFSDQGETFYPDFADPLKAVSLEVIDFDEGSGTAKPFKVEFKNGVWSIPSHHDYPADGKDRLAKTAAGVIDLKKDIVQSDRAQDHQALGVIDPLDDSTPTLQGRGQRVTLRDQGKAALADFIVGKPVEGKNGFRYVRIPGKKRTYGVKMDVDISTRFADWIETNLLKLTTEDVRSIQISDYSVDEATGTVDMADTIDLGKSADNKWDMNGLPEGKELDESKINLMASALSEITITGVRPKPESLTRNLTAKQGLRIDPFTQISLQSKGFFISQDGSLLSNEGEVRVVTKQGVQYTLRFGEVIFGDGLDISAGVEDATTSGVAQEKPEDATENRYLFVTVGFDNSLFGPKPIAPEGYEPAQAEDDKAEVPATTPDEDAEKERSKTAAEKYERELKEWEEKEVAGRKLVEKLNERFAPWYYVISAKDFKNIRLNRDKLIKTEPRP